jgi:hypothetical protein
MLLLLLLPLHLQHQPGEPEGAAATRRHVGAGEGRKTWHCDKFKDISA